MKKILYIIISLVFLFGLSSCENWLDVNVDPDNPNDQSATVENRLPWIEHYYLYAWGVANVRASFLNGTLGYVSSTSSNSYLCAWNPLQGSCTTMYQNWFLGAACNLEPLITRAEEEGAYHYIGAAYCIKSMGFLLMLDLYGEMPYTEALTGKYNPAYDQGDVIYDGCMADLDKAIEYFEMDQEDGATPLSDGDVWNGGDVNKWIKLCYGLKARYLLQISKKSTYDGDAVLAALTNAPQSNSDNITCSHYNVTGDAEMFTTYDPYQTNVTWDYAAYGTSQRATRWFANLLTNNFTGGSGVVDPRMTKILPAMMTNIHLNSSGVIDHYEWARDIGVDMMNSDIRQNSGPINPSYLTAEKTIDYTISDATARAEFISTIPHSYVEDGDTVSVTYPAGAVYINSTNYKRAGDTVYVTMRSNSLSTSGLSATDMKYYLNSDYGVVGGTGSVFVRPTSKSYIVTYAEMCFIKAEVYFRQGKTGDAWDAYKAGITASMEQIQSQLSDWEASTDNPDEMPMDEADITAFMASAAVAQSSAELTMSDIMQQKIIAMGFNLQNWSDMRRFNYSAGNIGSYGVVYKDYKRPYEFTATNKMPGTSPTDPTYWVRRFNQSAHESNYNSTQLMASNPLAMQDAIWSDPVWWDIEDN